VEDIAPFETLTVGLQCLVAESMLLPAGAAWCASRQYTGPLGVTKADAVAGFHTFLGADTHRMPALSFAPVDADAAG
jgi:hypothetical protein